MFSGFKFRMAKNSALIQMEVRGRITKEKQREMSFVAGAEPNATFGKALIASGTALTSHAAAAAVFARIAAAAERNPSGQITADDWALATRVALINAGASETESFMAAQELISMHRNVAQAPSVG